MCAKKNPCFGRVVEGLFLSKPGQKRKQTLDMCKLTLISGRYDKHPFFGPMFIKIKHSSIRPNQFLFAQKSVHLFMFL